jgi:hypothetical protein
MRWCLDMDHLAEAAPVGAAAHSGYATFDS